MVEEKGVDCEEWLVGRGSGEWVVGGGWLVVDWSGGLVGQWRGWWALLQGGLEVCEGSTASSPRSVPTVPTKYPHLRRRRREVVCSTRTRPTTTTTNPPPEPFIYAGPVCICPSPSVPTTSTTCTAPHPPCAEEAGQGSSACFSAPRPTLCNAPPIPQEPRYLPSACPWTTNYSCYHVHGNMM